MIFLTVLIAATLAAAAVRPRDARRDHARRGLAIAMVVAGISHFAQPAPFEDHLPDVVPAETALVYISGGVEIGLGVALLLARQRRQWVGTALSAFLLAVFPANIYVAAAGVDVEGQPGGPYPWIRLPLQGLFIAWAWWSTRSAAPRRHGDPEGHPQTAAAATDSGAVQTPSLTRPERAGCS